MTDIPPLHHIKPCNQILSIMKYGVNHVTLIGNVGEVPRVSEREGEEVRNSKIKSEMIFWSQRQAKMSMRLICKN
jgi:hypothetical protein